jgi:hypothetical protein
VSKNTRRLAQERARQVVAAQRRAEARRRRMTWAGGAIGVVVLILAVFVVVKLTGGNSTPAVAQSAHPADSGLISAVTGVSSSVLDQVGTGKPDALPKTMSGQPALNDNSKPLILYIGAEYCPYCAAERWSVVVALSRFGTFTNLGQTTSSASDVYASTPTLTFHGATYTSQYLSFQGVETQSNQPSGGSYKTLDTMTSDQTALFKKYDAPPYVDSTGSIPFIDFFNKAVVQGASYSPQLLQGKSHEQVAAALSQPSSDLAKAIDGTANAFTALICSVTGNQPTDVCTGKAATAYQGKFGASS